MILEIAAGIILGGIGFIFIIALIRAILIVLKS
jgi:hypothetical protein